MLKVEEENMAAKWVEEVTPSEWQKWMDITRRVANQRQMNTSLGSDAYASEAIEKLLKQEERPANVEAWLRTVIRNLFIDRSRRNATRKFDYFKDVDNEEVEREMISLAIGPSSRAIQLDEVRRILNTLSVREQELLVLSAAGIDNHDIADELGYATNKTVATRIKQIQENIRKTFSEKPQE